MTQTTLLPNAFKQGLRDGRKQPGLWLSLESPNATEVVAGSGFDWLMLDLEHSVVDLGDVVHHLRAARGGTAEVMVRVPWNEPVVVKRLLDAGVRTFMFPFVQNAEEARRAVAATRYPPHGIRGFAGNSRANNYARISGYAETGHESQCVVVQVETPEAVANIAEIGRVEGVDAIFVGPNDLAANMGFLARSNAPEVHQAVADALTAIKATGKGAGMLEYNVPVAKRLFEAGYDFVAVSSDLAILARRSEALLSEFRG